VVTRAAEDGWKRMFGLDTGAARPEAPEAKEPCQRSVPAGDTTAKRGRCMTAGTVLRSLRSNTVSGLARVLAEGAGGRPFFLAKVLNIVNQLFMLMKKRLWHIGSKSPNMCIFADSKNNTNCPSRYLHMRRQYG